MTEHHNRRRSSIFQGHSEVTPVRRLNFDEIVHLAGVVVHISINARRNNQFFILRDVLHLALQMSGSSATPETYARPVYQLMQRFVLLGAVLDVSPIDTREADLLSRSYRSGVEYELDEWASQQLAADAFGLPYVAHRFAPLAVRVIAPRSDGDPGMGSGVVLGPGLIVTNRHVIENAAGSDQVSISIGESSEVTCTAFRAHDNPDIDLAVIFAPGFHAQPFPWLRDPESAEEVIALAYPFVPQVRDPRPQLAFTGTVATSQPLTTYWGSEQCIINAVMPPGASGGPIFGKDGRLVGIVVRMLDGQTMEDGEVLTSTLHAFLPAGLLLRELPKLHPQFTFLNRFASIEECASIIDAFPNKWWLGDTTEN